MEDTAIDIDLKNHIEAQVSEITRNHAWWTGTFEKINKTVCQLEKLVCTTEATELAKITPRIWNNTSEESLKIMNDGYCRWETEVENQFAHKILTEENVKSEDYLLYERFLRLISKELHLLKNTPFESIIFIGSGPFPITAILLHELTGKKIDCLEQHQESATISRKVLKKLGLSEAIHVHVGNGATFDLSPYDVVLAALLAKPKSVIMQNILTNGNPACKVLCRTSEGLRRLLYETTLEDAYVGFDKLGFQSAGYDDTISTMLVAPQKKSSDDTELVWLDALDVSEVQLLVDMANRIISDDNNNGYTKPRHVDDYLYSQLRQDVQAGLKRILVIKIKNSQRYVGQAMITLFHQDTYVHRGDICSLMLHKSARSKEMSLAIAEELIKECERLNLEIVTIDVRAGSGQEKLWRYLGFNPYGELPKYAKVGTAYFSGIHLYQEVESMKTILRRRLEAMYSK